MLEKLTLGSLNEIGEYAKIDAPEKTVPMNEKTLITVSIPLSQEHERIETLCSKQ